MDIAFRLAFGLIEGPHHSPCDTIRDYEGDRRLVVAIDGLLDAAAGQKDRLSQECGIAG